jgi:phospho-N-acetylmuramoyl-pentapeptide-transferase
MVKILLFTLGSLVFSFVLAPFVIKLLYRLQIREEIRRSGPVTHLVKQGTPTMAGFLMVFSVTFINLVFNLSRSETYLPIFALMLAGVLGASEDISKIYKKSIIREGTDKQDTPFLREFSYYLNLKSIFEYPWDLFRDTFRLLGSYDSVGLKSYQKYIIELAIGLFFSSWFYYKLGWNTYWMPLLGSVPLGFFYIPISAFLFTVFLNSVAITDGLDGLAGGLSVVLFGSLGTIAFFQNQIGLAIFCASMVGSLLAFLYFNFYPARVFMGNIGSHSLGATAFVVAYMLHKEILLFVIGGIFVLEVISDIIQVGSKRMGYGKVFKMAPIHHHFELSGWPETKVTMRFWLLGIVFCLFGLLLSFI